MSLNYETGYPGPVAGPNLSPSQSDRGPPSPGSAPTGIAGRWLEFLEQSGAIFETHGDIPFGHWHHYETTKVRAYMDRHGDDSGPARRVLCNCVDLLPITRDAVVLPASSHSLNAVERRTGCRRTLDDYGGNRSIARHIDAVETDDESACEATVQEILDYNREDLNATWTVTAEVGGLPASPRTATSHCRRPNVRARSSCELRRR